MNSKLTTILMAAVAASLFAGQAGRADAVQFGGYPRSFGSPLARGFQPLATQKPCRIHARPGTITPYIFTSDNITGTLYEYCEDMPINPTTPHRMFTNIAGWGLAVSPDKLGPLPNRERLAVGTNGGSVNVFNVANNGTLTQQKTLVLGISSQRGNALGLCFDVTGGLYATNYPYNEIDYFNNAAVVGGALAPTTRYFTTLGGTAPFYPAYLACDYDKLMPGSKNPPPPSVENNVMVDGLDSTTNNVDVGQLNVASAGTVTVLPGQVLGAYGLGSHFPGGMTIDKKDDLVVSDWYAGTLLNFGPKEPWPAPLNFCKTEGSGTTEADLPIDFDDTQHEIWAGNSFTTTPGAATNAVSTPFPFKSVCPSRGESGGPTTPITNEFFIGIAVWPNTGV